MTDAPTPEVAAYWGHREATEATLRTLRRRFTAMAALTLVIIITATIVFFVKIDGKVSAIEATTYRTRTVQEANTKVSVCQKNAINAALGDAILAIKGDHNPSDYAPIVKC